MEWTALSWGLTTIEQSREPTKEPGHFSLLLDGSLSLWCLDCLHAHPGVEKRCVDAGGWLSHGHR